MASDSQLVERYYQLVRPHIDSFDFLLDEGLQRIINHTRPIEVKHPVTQKIYRVSVSNPSIGRPTSPYALGGGLIYPRECREMKQSYTAPLDVEIMVNRICINRTLGQIPVMVKSRACNMRGMSPEEMIKRGEEANDFGGYFIADGLEKKRHIIMAKDRMTYIKNGPLFTSKVTNIRCVRDDELGRSVSCHYLSDGSTVVGFSLGKVNFFLPSGVILRSLFQCNDRELFEYLISGCGEPEGSSHAIFVEQHAELCIQEILRLGLHTQVDCMEYIGQYFRSPMQSAQWRSDYEVGVEFLEEYIFCHLTTLKGKFLLLIQMLQKLFAFVNSMCCEDKADSLGCQEILPSGFLLMKVIADLMKQSMLFIKAALEKELQKAPENTDLEDPEKLNKIVRPADIGRKLLYLMKTGKYISLHTRDIGQNGGLAIIAERINFLRYLSHFRAAHRGDVYTHMRTTQPRKLLPDSWGFICPVHTPDGPPCGLLLHLSSACRISIPSMNYQDAIKASITQFLVSYGMIPCFSELHPPTAKTVVVASLDGEVIGYISDELIQPMLDRLHFLKCINNQKLEDPSGRGMESLTSLSVTEMEIPSDIELAYLPIEEGGPYPGLYLFTKGGRFVCPVRNVKHQMEEWIGSLEQLTLSNNFPDADTDPDLHPELEVCSYEELNNSNCLSILAALTPFSDFNQSPRNMYQCQMSKQTMGTPCHDFDFRPHSKLYRLQTPQKPICRTEKYKAYELDNYPSGTNAVVAVLAYTGYDMEDAMILNRSSVDRGFAHGCMYKTEQIFLSEQKTTEDCMFLSDVSPPDNTRKKKLEPGDPFGRKYPINIPIQQDSKAVKNKKILPTANYENAECIDVDGLPHVGSVIKGHTAYCSIAESHTGVFTKHKLKGDETAIIEQVGVIGTGSKTGLRNANIKFRFNRNPVVGDKFASRSGQKGILSQRWPDTDFPYCASTGMRPDLVINPHAFPSRMTIGMLIESLTSKAAALKGEFVDCSPFQQWDKKEDIVKVCGKYLEKAGFQKQGIETMISGITGEEMQCDIYIGLVYYQRLRHMVSDKYQCRATGPVNSLTKQPVQGRKFGGGIRVGEMERDSFISHGASFLMSDRLCISSDRHTTLACKQCGSIIAPHAQTRLLPEIDARLFRRLMSGGRTARNVVCPICGNASNSVVRYCIPKVLSLLGAELAGVNIGLKVIPDSDFC